MSDRFINRILTPLKEIQASLIQPIISHNYYSNVGLLGLHLIP